MDKNIHNIIFDVGMVLIDFCWEQCCRSLGLDEEVIRNFGEKMICSNYWDMMDEGIIEEEDAIQEFIKIMPQYEKEITLFWEHPEGFVKEYDFAAPMISRLKEKGYNVYLLSNYPAHLFEIHWPTFSFFSMVDGYVVSALEKIRKPDSTIYRLICDRYHLKPDECLFIDDRQINVDAAINVGMRSVLFRDYETLKEYLELYNCEII